MNFGEILCLSRDPAAAGGAAGAVAVAGAGAPPVAPNNANNGADGGNGNDVATDHEIAPALASSPMPLQGKDGLVARFSSALYAILGKWEWDKVDRDILLGQSLVPLVQQLLILFVGPIVAFLGWSKLLSFLTRGRGRAGIICKLRWVGGVAETASSAAYDMQFLETHLFRYLFLSSSFCSTIRWICRKGLVPTVLLQILRPYHIIDTAGISRPESPPKMVPSRPQRCSK